MREQTETFYPDLRDRAVLVTGAASGIGKALCAQLARAGALILAVDRDGPALDRACEALRRTGGAAVPLTADLGHLSDIDELDRALAAMPDCRLAGAVNCAALVMPAPFLELTSGSWDEVMGVNLRAPLLLSQLVARRLIAERRAGSIVHVSSTASTWARPGLAAYAASKAALEQLTKVQAIELAAHGIRVNAVRPGLVDTDGVRRAAAIPAGQAEHQAKLSRIPLGRAGEAAEIAELIMFLLSSRSAYCTGAVFTADGGYTLGLPTYPRSAR